MLNFGRGNGKSTMFVNVVENVERIMEVVKKDKVMDRLDYIYNIGPQGVDIKFVYCHGCEYKDMVYHISILERDIDGVIFDIRRELNRTFRDCGGVV